MHFINPIFSILPYETTKVLAQSSPYLIVGCTQIHKWSLSLCVSIYCPALSSYLKHISFLPPVLGALFLPEMLPIFLENFQDLEDIVLIPLSALICELTSLCYYYSCITEYCSPLRCPVSDWCHQCPGSI